MIIRSPLRAATLGCGLLLLIQSAAAPGKVLAQTQPRVAAVGPARFDPEFRVDAIVARINALQAGVGMTVVTGTYVRSGVVAGLGFSRGGLSGRIDGVTRFHFDPFRQSRWGPYGGGGISGRFDRGAGARAYLLLLAGIDGPVKGGMTPSFELGLGGGARVGVIVRRATGERR